MPDTVHHALAFQDEAHVEISHQNTFAMGQGWRKVLALGRDDGCHAAARQRLAQFFVGRNSGNLLLSKPSGRIHDKTARFQCMVSNGYFDLVTENRPDK